MNKKYKQINAIIGFIVFAISLWQYTSTLESAGSLWDCGEFASCVYKLQVAHPPGAPFFMLLGRIFTLFNPSNIEIATSEQFKNHTTDITKLLNWNYTLVPDTLGMVTPKVVSMIINEAYYALEENVSTKNDIDTAMQLGTNYPYGPFEWAKKIGLNSVYQLLNALSSSVDRYTVSEALKKEVIHNQQ